MNNHDKEPVGGAVALRWEGRGAPTVTAKGRGETARRIQETAERHGVPLRQETELLEMLLLVNLNEEIPTDLYVAVAEIMAFAYSLKAS